MVQEFLNNKTIVRSSYRGEEDSLVRLNIILIKGLILLAIILVKHLYWVLQRPVGLKFFIEEAFLHLGIRQI